MLSAVDFCTLAQVKMSTVHLSISYQPSGRLRHPPATKYDLIKDTVTANCLLQLKAQVVLFSYHHEIMARSSGVVAVTVRYLQAFTK